jgi:uncharacterized membrane protein YdjX (TVP38/TMEM64 family)
VLHVALTVPAGFSYGLLAGFAIAYPVSLASALVAFALGRGLFRERLERRFRGDVRVARIEQAVQARGVLVVVLARLTPMFPFAPVNYLFSVTSVTARQYTIGTAIGIAPNTLFGVYLGSIATNAVAALHGDGLEAWHLAIPFAALIAISVVLTQLARHALRA